MKRQEIKCAPTVKTCTPDPSGRQETFPPTLQVQQSVRSAIEVTVKDLEPSEQSITDRCGKVDLQLSTHRDWSQPNFRL